MKLNSKLQKPQNLIHTEHFRDFLGIKSSSCPCTYVATKYSFPLIKPLLWEWAWQQPRKLAVCTKFVQSSESKPNSSNKNRLAHKQIIQKFRAIDIRFRALNTHRYAREMTEKWPEIDHSTPWLINPIVCIGGGKLECSFRTGISVSLGPIMMFNDEVNTLMSGQFIGCCQ